MLVRSPKFFSRSPLGRKGTMRSCEHPRAALLEPEPAVPKGFLAVYVGDDMRRFVIPMEYLRLPAFEKLMEAAAEEFGYGHEGGIRIPCREEAFEEALKVLEETRKKEKCWRKERVHGMEERAKGKSLSLKLS